MLTYVFRRLLISVLLLAIISVISFMIFKMTPGASSYWFLLNPKISQAAKQNYIRKFHLDQPLHRQYWIMMTDLFRGRLVSNKDERPVIEKISERLPATLRLNAVSLLIEFAFGISWGVYAAMNRGKWVDRAGSIAAFILITVPSFWLAYLLCIFLVKVVGVPILGIESFGYVYSNSLATFFDRLWHLMFPASILAIGGIAVLSRYVRASTLEVLAEDYIRTGRAKGLDEATVFYKHALRNSLRPVITMIGFLLPALIGGSVIIESIFAYPGIGRLGFEAVTERDYPVLVTLNLVAAALVLVGNLIADILYAVVDPRVRLD
ncbi:MAG: ABC transporter permease [Verrucomicrobiae bacterium]|nr:ABC transporter permease [Verrucomicrobiae bacterium]